MFYFNINLQQNLEKNHLSYNKVTDVLKRNKVP